MTYFGAILFKFIMRRNREEQLSVSGFLPARRDIVMMWSGPCSWKINLRMLFSLIRRHGVQYWFIILCIDNYILSNVASNFLSLMSCLFFLNYDIHTTHYSL